ncbi:MAG TPA: hypothetical protein VFN40_09050 [Gemmatimonadales bacterium]|jgi:hypothetical protein|nr:hypothetical protein [Gemmatimonadales bacterium]
MGEGTPARIDRAALERIIQRAAELQTADRDIGEELTPDQVLALGREVGIPGRYLQQALLEERTRLVAVRPAGAWERIAGAGQVVAQRAVPGTVAAVEAALVEWMEEKELFCVQRRQPGRITWEPLGGVAAAVRRSTAAFSRGAAAMMLARADTVSATIMALETGWCHVVLTAETRNARAQLVGGGVAVAGAGAIGASLMVVLGALLPVALLPVPVTLAIGYGVARQYRSTLARIQLGLERALDQLEHGAAAVERQLPRRTGGLLGLLAEEIRRSLR